jgi:hypothetical protein
LGAEVRAIKGADATCRPALGHFGHVLEATVDTDLGWFPLRGAAPRPMTAVTNEGGPRYPILVLLDVNAGVAPLSIPVISAAQHLVGKVYA